MKHDRLIHTEAADDLFRENNASIDIPQFFFDKKAIRYRFTENSMIV